MDQVKGIFPPENNPSGSKTTKNAKHKIDRGRIALAEGDRGASNLSVVRMSHAYAISDRSKSPEMTKVEKVRPKPKTPKNKKALVVSASQEQLNRDIADENLTVEKNQSIHTDLEMETDKKQANSDDWDREYVLFLCG